MIDDGPFYYIEIVNVVVVIVDDVQVDININVVVYPPFLDLTKNMIITVNETYLEIHFPLYSFAIGKNSTECHKPLPH